MDKFTNSEHKEEILEKIRKILAIANGSNFEDEANTAMGMAKKLMTQYGLDMSDVEIKEDITAGIIEDSPDRNGKIMAWEKGLATVLQVLCDIKPILIVSGYTAKFKFIGYRDDVYLALEMFNHLATNIQRLARQNYSDCHMRRSYMLGMTMRLVERAQRIQAEAKMQAKKYGEIVLVKDKAIKEYQDDKYKNLQSGNHRTKYTRSAFERGYEHGDNVDLNLRKKLNQGA